MASFFPERNIQYLGCFDLLVAVVAIHVTHVLLDLLPDCPALWVPKNQPRAFFLKMKQVKFATNFAMIAKFGLCKHMQMRVLVVFVCQAVP